MKGEPLPDPDEMLESSATPGADQKQDPDEDDHAAADSEANALWNAEAEARTDAPDNIDGSDIAAESGQDSPPDDEKPESSDPPGPTS